MPSNPLNSNSRGELQPLTPPLLPSIQSNGGIKKAHNIFFKQFKKPHLHSSSVILADREIDRLQKKEENVGRSSSEMEASMGYMGSPRLHNLESFATNVLDSLLSFEKTNKEQLDHHAVMVRVLASRLGG
ncbi:hypothetical protein L6452_31100 [Arctium lappa]|uniref:Uncharacterized protein n=1 Tax=Arctium lappa TaxID=4217 RepID=A0ACB8ZKX2_ARCLA|nr:hypothetical protein L6452_31100 [Arctium lappa]